MAFLGIHVSAHASAGASINIGGGHHPRYQEYPREQYRQPPMRCEHVRQNWDPYTHQMLLETPMQEYYRRERESMMFGGGVGGSRFAGPPQREIIIVHDQPRQVVRVVHVQDQAEAQPQPKHEEPKQEAAQGPQPLDLKEMREKALKEAGFVATDPRNVGQSPNYLTVSDFNAMVDGSKPLPPKAEQQYMADVARTQPGISPNDLIVLAHPESPKAHEILAARGQAAGQAAHDAAAHAGHEHDAKPNKPAEEHAAKPPKHVETEQEHNEKLVIRAFGAVGEGHAGRYHIVEDKDHTRHIEDWAAQKMVKYDMNDPSSFPKDVQEKLKDLQAHHPYKPAADSAPPGSDPISTAPGGATGQPVELLGGSTPNAFMSALSAAYADPKTHKLVEDFCNLLHIKLAAPAAAVDPDGLATPGKEITEAGQHKTHKGHTAHAAAHKGHTAATGDDTHAKGSVTAAGEERYKRMEAARKAAAHAPH